MIRPEGFSISDKATDHHHITTQRALDEGVSLSVALESFMATVVQIDTLGGNVVIHNLEFDAGIVARFPHLLPEGDSAYELLVG